MRFREDRPRELARARAAVSAWRDRNPAGTAEQLVAALGAQFHPDYGPVLRAVLFSADRHSARTLTGVMTEPAEAVQGELAVGADAGDVVEVVHRVVDEIAGEGLHGKAGAVAAATGPLPLGAGHGRELVGDGQS